ncbi:hypothetical protein N0V93_007488 [Gnomoniopsis smithogilvyi]|uniref:Quinone oxidoreductase n=1 Tax=Gnomoniopsis smithogilvyi TaxID=1191159 RepID=A0A9W8YTV8_9PEZI|nr:hypothetical protein N0V93_007488 [Gnomoniopsis smithogilvyi]
MKQAQVTSWADPPTYIQVADPDAPPSGHVQLQVLAAGVHQLVRSRAAGKHYSAKVLPHIPGVDGIGQDSNGKLYYFNAMTEQGGSMTEIINVPTQKLVPVPEGADPIQIAGLVNPVMASWMALAKRTTGLPPGFTALILGATGMSGIAAVDVARVFGAGKVVGVARNAAKMAGLGLDAMIELGPDQAHVDWSPAMDADVVLDFLYGPVTLSFLQALKSTKPVQYVQIGTVVERTIDIPGDILRSKDITIRGTGPGSWQLRDFAEQAREMVIAITSGKVRPGTFREAKMADIESVWTEKGGDRVVITP